MKPLFLVALALLVSDTAAGLASGLARGLALAAAAVGSAFAQVTGLEGLDVFHGLYLHLFFGFSPIYHICVILSIFHISLLFVNQAVQYRQHVGATLAVALNLTGQSRWMVPHL